MNEIFSTTEGLIVMGALIGAGGFALGASQTIATVGTRILRPGRRNRDARSLAMLAVLALDDYVGASYAAVHDVPEFNPADPEEFVFHVPEPVLVLPKDVDWQLLGRDLGDDVLWFSNRASNLENALESLDLSRSDHDGFFERRIEGYSRLAARAMDLIARICGEFELTMPEKPDYYQQAERLSKILRNVESIAARKSQPSGISPSEETNVTPLFPKKS